MNARGRTETPDALRERLLAPARRYDPERTLRRLSWTRVWTSILLVAAIALVVTTAAHGEWRAAITFSVLTLPGVVERWLERPDVDGLVVDADFLERERAGLARRVERHRGRVLLGYVMAAVLAVAATFATRFPEAWWGFSAFFAIQSLVRGVFVLPALSRELRDYGLEPESWSTPVFSTALFVLLPILMPAYLIWRGFRRLLGRPVEDDDEEEDAKDEDRP